MSIESAIYKHRKSIRKISRSLRALTVEFEKDLQAIRELKCTKSKSK